MSGLPFSYPCLKDMPRQRDLRSKMCDIAIFTAKYSKYPPMAERLNTLWLSLYNRLHGGFEKWCKHVLIRTIRKYLLGIKAKYKITFVLICVESHWCYRVNTIVSYPSTSRIGIHLLIPLCLEQPMLLALGLVLSIRHESLLNFNS